MSHEKDCKFRRAIECPVAIECEHGYDVCPKCDPCTCHEIRGWLRVKDKKRVKK